MAVRRRIPTAGELRRSQVVTTFGPGAMLDLPTVSVIVGGLDFWKGVEFQTPIAEERLQAKVAELLRLPSVRFYPPPVEDDAPDARRADIGVIRFPRWFLAQVERTFESGGRTYRTRPLVPERHLDKGKWYDENRKACEVVPVRFVQACPRGHISDIDWHRYVGADRSASLWLDEGGAGNDFAEIYVRIEGSNQRRQLADATVLKNRILGFCQGDLTWMGQGERESCNQPNRLLTRSATNAYFPQKLGVISIPDADAMLRNAVEAVWKDHLEYSESTADVDRERKRDKVRAALEAYPTAAVWREVERRRAGRGVELRPIKQVEVETLRAAPPGDDEPAEEVDFHARAREPARFRDLIDRVVLVHRLRMVEAQVGFTRFEAYAPDVQGELDLDVQRASLAKEVTWVPAVEYRGEGVFVGFSKGAIEEWQRRKPVQERGRQLARAHDAAFAERHGPRPDFAGLPYYALHTLSHLLITEVSLSCGYSSSSIRERVYVGESGYGILLYTGVAGSEGTLGGLVAVGKRIEEHLARALSKAKLCSNDPVCAQHDPESKYEDRLLHGAACHGCLLIGETSCERYNQLLDRALVVPTVAEAGAALFAGTEWTP